jgi:hypothetical protein
MKLRENFALFGFALLSAILLGACDSDTTGVREFHESEKHSFSQFISGIERFPYLADRQKVSRITEGFKRLSVGMRKDDVEKAMGKPDSEMLEYSETKNGKALVGSTWGYYLKRKERELANPSSDEAVFLYFKVNDELYWAQPENVVGLEALGGTSAKNR